MTLTHLLHVIPVSDNAVLDGVLQGEDTSLALSLITNVRVLLAHTHHHALVARTANDGGEHSTRSIITGKSSFAHTRAIIDYQRSNIFVTHFDS